MLERTTVAHSKENIRHSWNKSTLVKGICHLHQQLNSWVVTWRDYMRGRKIAVDGYHYVSVSFCLCILPSVYLVSMLHRVQKNLNWCPTCTTLYLSQSKQWRHFPDYLCDVTTLSWTLKMSYSPTVCSIFLCHRQIFSRVFLSNPVKLLTQVKNRNCPLITGVRSGHWPLKCRNSLIHFNILSPLLQPHHTTPVLSKF